MSTPFLAEIKLISWNFAPNGWAFCNGQLLPINQNQALFSLLGTTYGGNGQTNFALPDLRGRAPIHRGTFVQGQAGGATTHTLTLSELPQHTHLLNASSAAASALIPDATQMLANGPSELFTGGPSNLVSMDPSSISSVGGSQPHENIQPYLVLNFIIALVGVFPSQN